MGCIVLCYVKVVGVEEGVGVTEGGGAGVLIDKICSRCPWVLELWDFVHS